MGMAGIWLMVSPGVLGFGKQISDNAHIAGPVIASFSVIAIWECTRNVRWFNLPIATWLLLAPWVLQYNDATATANDYAVAALIILLSLVKPKRQYRFGGGWPAIWRGDTLHEREAANRSARH